MSGTPHKRILTGNELMAALAENANEMLFLDVESLDRMVVHRVNRVLATTKSRFQLIDLFHAPHLGFTLALDGIIQVAQSDEHIYHELLVHPACLLLPRVRSAIILGGGDGCAARELLKYRELETLKMVEMDSAVIEVCRTHFKEVNNGSLDDPRLTTIVQEAEAYLVRIPEKRYDLIVADLTDPYDTSGQPGELAGVISTEGSCLSLKSHMNSGGILAVQTGGLTANPEVDSYHNALIEGLRRHFKKVETAYEYIRSFDQVWSFTLASDYPYDVTGLDPDSVLLKRGISGLRHYDTVSHRKAFQRPRQIRDLIG